ncbi:MAG: hypothetical protein Q4G71_12385, partial [Pseudomonadota bacterium]|nr:hypothetical protein [Pseudomonadota bacterium]
MSILSSLRRVRVWLVLAAALCGVGALAAPIGFTGNYAQNFDSLADSGSSNAWANGQTLEGWYLFDRNKGDITTYLAGSGTGTGGGFYSFGSSASDRALGGLGSGGAYFGNAASGAVAGWIALAATNNSGSAIDRVTIRFNGEQWRNGGNTSAQPMTLEYGMGSSFAAVVTWTPAGADFNWASPVTGATAGAVDGNAAGRVADVGGTLTGLNWTAGQTLWLRWAEVNDNGNDHGLAIDDFSLTAATANADTALFTPNPGTTSGSSDASTAIALDADWMIVGDDEASVLRVYPRAGGAAVAEWSFDGVLGLRGEELDVEASTRIGNTLYFIGSHSNKRAGAEADSREHLFAVTTSGTGAATTFSFVGQYGGLEQALVSWDSGNAHGKG